MPASFALESGAALARSWLEQRLVEQGLSIEQLVHQESQSQASDQVSVSHSIASLRLLSAIDWKEFVETLSLVEQTLRSEPADVYSEMDFATRDRYRHVVESLARQSQLSETEMAQKAVELAEESARQKGREDRTAHVGFYLIDKGRPLLERAAKVRWPWKNVRRAKHSAFSARVLCRRNFFAHAAGNIRVLARRRQTLEVQGWKLIFCTLIFLLGVSQLAVALLNWLVHPAGYAAPLPRLDYSSGIAPDSRTMVVVPTMLTEPGRRRCS